MLVPVMGRNRSFYTFNGLPCHEIFSPCWSLSIEIHHSLAVTDHIYTRTNWTASHASDLVNADVLL